MDREGFLAGMQKSLPARIPIYIENVSVVTIASVNASDWDKLFARRNWIVKSAHLGLGRSRRQRELCGWRDGSGRFRCCPGRAVRIWDFPGWPV